MPHLRATKGGGCPYCHADLQTACHWSPVRWQNFFHLPAPLAVAKGDIVEALVWTQGDDQIHVYGGSEGVTPPERQSGPAEKVRLEGNFLKDR